MNLNPQMRINPPGNCLMNHKILRIKDKLFSLRFQIFRSPRGNLSLSLMRVVRVWRVQIARLVKKFIRRKIIIMIRRGLIIFKMGMFLKVVYKTLIACFTKIIIYKFNSKILTPTLVRRIISNKQQINHRRLN